MRRVRYARAATEDIASIVSYISEHTGSAVVAVRFTKQMRERCAKLASLPGKMGRSRDELAPGLRSVAFGNYVILFRYEQDALRVINILEGHRDLDGLFSDNH